VNDLRLGIPGAGEIQPGTHLCALYSGPEERGRLLASFMREGVRHGDECVCLIDDLDPADVGQRTYRPATPDDARRWHLAAYPSPDAYLVAGEFTVEQMTSPSVAYPASAEGECALLRAAGEMSWVPHEPGAKAMSVYEAAVSRILADLPALFLCMYDLERFDVGMLVEVLRIHSKVLLEGTVLDNPHSVAPTTYPESTPDAVQHFPLARLRTDRVDEGDQWLSLTGAEVRVAELVACGMTNKATAEALLVSPHTVDAHLKHMYVKLGIHSRVELTVLALRHGRPSLDPGAEESRQHCMV
jgi:DNA-binding CsgD family transcriptional regulator